MANVYKNNVIIVDTSAQFDFKARIQRIHYVAGTGQSVSIKTNDSSGTVIYEASGASDLREEYDLNLFSGFYVTVGTGDKVYIYLKG